MKFAEKLEIWFDKFRQMKPGQSIEIAVTGKRDPALFIDVCKEFINTNEDFEFSSDWKYFRRITPYPPCQR